MDQNPTNSDWGTGSTGSVGGGTTGTGNTGYGGTTGNAARFRRVFREVALPATL